MRKKVFMLCLMMFILITSAMAQITTSGLSGKVTADDGEVIGAHVEATHLPSGTRYKAVTNVKGVFSMQGMRVGGPYQVKITYIGFETKVIDNITLELGETYRINTTMSENVRELGNVIVTGSNSKFPVEKTGATTNISNRQLINMPTVSRSITEVTRLSPYGGNGMSFQGSDGRTANFTVDGANFNNNFGLSSKLPGGGNPISLDAIEEIQVVISPFDVRQTNFIGGGVNAITKSGTNTFKGSAYVYHQNEQMRGDAINGSAIDGAREIDRKTTYGFTFGGPIIKDKLHFFVNGEMSKIPTVVNRWRASDDGVADASNYLSRTSVADMQTVSDYVKNKYNYDTGSYTDFPADENNYKLLARVDWNINDKHHLAVRYNFTKNRYYSTPSSTSMDGGTVSAYGRTSQYSMTFANSLYAMDNLVHSFSLDLNSRLTDNLSNQFLATFSKLDDVRQSDSSEFPFIDILKDGENYMCLGYELFTWNNAVHNTVWNIKDDVTYYLENHKIMAGLTFEHQMADNQYMRNGTGYYRYDSLDDFLSGATPSVVCLTYGYNGEGSPAARVRYNKAGIYAQDEWNINDRFKLTYGLRIEDLFFSNSDLMTNQTIYDKYTYNGRRIDTGTWPNSNIMLSPRVGFNYDVFGDKSFRLRGGTGLFSGRLPLVFFTNMPTNSGMIQCQAQLNSSRFDMTKFSGGLVTDSDGRPTIAALRDFLIANGYPSTITPEDGADMSSISAVDPDFKMPQTWKTSIAVDYSVPVSFPFTVTAEGIFNKTLNASTIVDWSIPSVAGFTRFNGVDNRPIYPSGFRSNPKAFMLSNTSKGYAWSASLSLNAKPFEWMEVMAAYTHQVTKEITSMPGSNAESAFTYVPTIEGPNNIKLHNAYNVTPDRFVASMNLHDKSGNHYNFIFETWRGGYNYSYMLTNDMNGDGYKYDALYIPTDEEVNTNKFRFVSTDDKERFMAYVHSSDYLSKHQGEYAEAYSLYSPWVYRVDFGYKHDFKITTGKNSNTLQVSFDMKNVLNFFNNKWGVMKYLNPEIGQDARILKFDHIDSDGYAVFSTPSAINGDTKTFVPYTALGQCWYASIGVRYIFN